MIDSYDYSGELGAEVPFEEIRNIQLGILDAITQYCEAHGLRYYISGGTLLGAVRHGGYIPWDDDIDINMPRPDCDRLLELTGGKIGEHIEIGSFDGPIQHSVPFVRAYDTDYILRMENKEKRVRAFTNVSIDIFPIDGLPKRKWASYVHYFIAKCLVILRRVAYYREVTIGWDWRRMIRFAAYLPAKAVGWRNWNRLIQKLSRMYDYEASRRVGVVCCCVHTNSERVPKDVYGEARRIEFEGRKLRAPADAKRYLTQIYGDYMELPPVEKRVRRHHFSVFHAKGGAK
ncbi:MAG: LicD family protein [Christensenellales bacterium]|jgi:lipopolysaccharide cholinephosphotransferase